jgi:hypothetical protein
MPAFLIETMILPETSTVSGAPYYYPLDANDVNSEKTDGLAEMIPPPTKSPKN